MEAEGGFFPGVGQGVDEEVDFVPPNGYDGHQEKARLDAQSVRCAPLVVSEQSDPLSLAAAVPASAPDAPRGHGVPETATPTLNGRGIFHPPSAG
eukprot:1918983-Pyramimonas_sp.AAC.1